VLDDHNVRGRHAVCRLAMRRIRHYAEVIVRAFDADRAKSNASAGFDSGHFYVATIVTMAFVALGERT